MITKLIEIVYSFLWGDLIQIPLPGGSSVGISLLIILLIPMGIYFTVRTRFLPIRLFPDMVRALVGTKAKKDADGKSEKKEKKEKGSLSTFQTLIVSTATRVGMGNLVGVVAAISAGGAGAVFWMWVSALLGMCTKFTEVTLAVHFRERNRHGDYVGGPMYYIKNGLGKNWKFLAVLYSAFGVLTVFGTGNATQVNTITTAIDTALINFNVISESSTGRLNLILGIVITLLVGMVLLGGIKRIGSVSEKLVPFMALFYVVLALGVVVINYRRFPAVLASIVGGAFDPRAFTGGAIGSVFLSMQKGVSRGIFSNEAGLGTGSIAHACADTRKPVKQGMFGIFEVFADTIVICTLTALVILCSGVPVNYGSAAGAELTIAGFTSTYGGWSSIFTAVALCCFAFSTIIGWGLYGSRCIEFLCKTDKVVRPFLVVYSFVAILGATVELDLLWNIADTFNGLMSIPNLIALLLLSGTVVRLVKEFFETES